MAAKQVRYGRTSTLVRDVCKLDSGRDGEIFTRDVAHSADPGRTIIDLARVGLGVGDQFRNGTRRKRWMDHKRAWRHSDSPDGREVRTHVVACIRKQRRGDCKRTRIAKCDGVAVRRALFDLARTKRAAGPTAVI